METLSIREMRNMLGQLDTLINASGEIIITKHGEAIARLLPIQGQRQRPTHENLHCLTGRLSTPSEKIIREIRDAR